MNVGGLDGAEGEARSLVSCPWLFPLPLQDEAVVAWQEPEKVLLPAVG